MAWVGRVDWRYETTFTWSAADDRRRLVELVAEGLDTVATVELNEQLLVGRTANSTAATASTSPGVLREGEQPPGRSPSPRPSRRRTRPSAELGHRPHVNEHPFNALRKMACNYGWDWGPALVTAGIWQARWRCAAGHGPARRASARWSTSSDGRHRRAARPRRPRAGTGAPADAHGRRPGRRRAGRRGRPARGETAARRRGRASPRRRSVWWPRGLRRSSRSTRRRVDAGRRRRRAPRRLDRARRVPHGRAGHHPGRRRAPRSPWSSTAPRSSPAASTGSPTTASPSRVSPRALRRAARPGRRRRRQPGPGLGRRAVRERRLLRRLRRARPARLAGLPVRLRRLRRGGAAARRGRGGGPRGRHPAVAAPQPGAVERQQREHLGLPRLGLAATRLDGASWGWGYYTELLPGDRRRARPEPALLPGHPVRDAARPATRTTRRTGPPTCGTCGTSSTTRTYRAYRAPLRRRVRLAGPADLVDPHPGGARRAAAPRPPRASSRTRRPRTATASSPAGSPRTCPSRRRSTTGTGPPR